MLLNSQSDSIGPLQIDFSENYSIIHRNEIQSAHWSHDQVTLYTACFWYETSDGKKAVKSYVIVSDYLHHDKYAVAVFNKLIMKDIKSIAPSIQILNIFSDGAGQHFKQRFTLSYASSAPIPVNWHFFATSHGKGAVDGISGTIKRNVYDGVLAGKFAPVDAKSFAECAAIVSKNIHISFVPSTTIADKKEELDAFSKDIPKIPDIHKIHCIRYQEPMSVKISVTSDEEEKPFSFKPSECVSELEVVPPLRTVCVCDFVCEKWCAVMWPKLNYWFLGHAISVDNEERSVTFHFLEQKAPGVNQFTDVNDVDSAPFSDIFYCLSDAPCPVSSSRAKCLKLACILHQQYLIPSDDATVATQTFLRNFRQCPDNGKTSLFDWRCLLWAQALGEQYAGIAGEVTMHWLQWRYHYLAISPEVSSLLTKLRRNYMLGLITNGPSRAQWEKVQQLNLRQYFDCILVSGDLPWEKPDQKIFLEACQFLGVQPRNCLMVGDKLETDIKGGKEASLGATVWIPLSGEEYDEHGPHPDYTLNSVMDLPRVLPTKPKLLRSIQPLADLEDCNSNGSDGS